MLAATCLNGCAFCLRMFSVLYASESLRYRIIRELSSSITRKQMPCVGMRMFECMLCVGRICMYVERCDLPFIAPVCSFHTQTFLQLLLQKIETVHRCCMHCLISALCARRCV